MKVIVIVGKKNDKKTHLIFKISNKKIINEIKTLVKEFNCQKAISNILSKGKFLKKLTTSDLLQEQSHLILTNTNAYWTLL